MSSSGVTGGSSGLDGVGCPQSSSALLSGSICWGGLVLLICWWLGTSRNPLSDIHVKESVRALVAARGCVSWSPVILRLGAMTAEGNGLSGYSASDPRLHLGQNGASERLHASGKRMQGMKVVGKGARL